MDEPLPLPYCPYPGAADVAQHGVQPLPMTLPFVERVRCLPLPPRSERLLNDHHAGHARPVVVGANVRVTASPLCGEVDVLLLARLEHQLGSLRVQDLGVLELDGLEKG